MGEAIDLLCATRVAAIVQAPRREDLIARAVAAARGGIKLLALPVSVPFVAEIAAEVADVADDVTVGIADVVHVDHVNLALAAGAELVLSPIADLELIETSRARGLDVIPSGATPSEVHALTQVHLGPIAIEPVGMLGGTEHLAWLRRLFPSITFVASGAIGPDAAPQYLEHGAAAVIVDKGLFPAETDPESAAIITARASALVELCADAVEGGRQSVT